VTATATPGTTTTTAPSGKTLGQQLVRIMTTTDHKLIGKMYLITSFVWFLLGGLMAMLIRSELAFPTTRSSTRALQPAVHHARHDHVAAVRDAVVLRFANVIMPLQIGAPDVAFPRSNMFSYWLYLFGGLIAASGSAPRRRRRLRLVAYTPLSGRVRSPGRRW
jgi:cytochrome c oxidase subunit 1